MQRMRAALKPAVRYWEMRRIWYNVALTPAALFGYFTATLLSFAVDDIQYLSTAKVAALFLLSAVGANVCYTSAYALEFWFGGGAPDSSWFRRGRTYAFVAGTLLGVVLAFAGGRNIGILQFQYPRR